MRRTKLNRQKHIISVKELEHNILMFVFLNAKMVKRCNTQTTLAKIFLNILAIVKTLFGDIRIAIVLRKKFTLVITSPVPIIREIYASLFTKTDDCLLVCIAILMLEKVKNADNTTRRKIFPAKLFLIPHTTCGRIGIKRRTCLVLTVIRFKRPLVYNHLFCLVPIYLLCFFDNVKDFHVNSSP